MEIDEKMGLISYLYDKKNNRVVMKSRLDEGAESDNAFPRKLRIGANNNKIPLTALSMNNMLQVLYEKPHMMSAWVIGPIGKVINLIDDPEIEILSNGPVLGVIRIKNKFNKSLIIQDIKMYKGIERIDFDTKLYWQEESGPAIDAPMLKVNFTPILGKTKARFEIPFGSIERVADGREFPALNWMDISDDDYGLSILSDTKHGFSANGNTAAMTMIRTSYEPDPEADRGEHSFIYSIYPHSGDFTKSDTVRKGYELNHKLIKSYFKGTGGNEMPEEKGFVSINTPDIILTAFKVAEDGSGLIIRVYESKGIKTDVIINFDFKVLKATEVDLTEETMEDKNLVEKNKIIFKIKPFEIKTFRLELQG
jgi:alpha-mannosidase